MNIARNVVCWTMIVLVPASLLATDSGVAMARPYGTAWLNGTAVQQSSAIFPGDLVQTSSSSALKIRSSGSSVTVLPDSLVNFEGGAVGVQHGGVKLVTSKGMSARAGILTATPASSAWTEFELTDVNGTVHIVALKGDLQISDGAQTTTLAEGQQATQTQEDSDQTQNKQGTPEEQKKKKKEIIIFVSAIAAAATAGVVALVVESGPAPPPISNITP
jgi:hypothetical protein